ncbi:hypothetical protein QBC40DRAFT_282437 [Triangularia verruculosa]|uniref:DUF7582 domain-containing protein n=1 Tax=Triangularia verruculosa TaxID=2587418 RepID=A0AAN6XGN9_9PEZI|nr:hypothetical protein QBC40DRAFT_282437 [Triangularia verruculosa]
MGCGGSKPAKKKGRQAAGGLQIGAPQDVTIHIPRNRLNAQGVPIQPVTRDINANVLRQALDRVSHYIASRGQRISVIAVGGAVNTLYLRSRHTTHDVDVFGSDFNNSARHLVDEAMHEAQRAIPALGTDWLNTETQMWLSGRLHAEITQAARAQNVIVFQGKDKGLTILAAPWAYAFSAKINRILTGGSQARPYDLQDAVAYIHMYIQAHGNKPVPVKVALGWARQYHHEMTENVLRNQVNPAYRRQYGGRNAFV